MKTNKNLFMMLAGHVTGEGSRVDTFNGNVVRTFVSDYQGWTNGGNGYLRILTFSPTNNQVVFQTYSPWTGEYQTGPNSELWFNYNMSQPLGSNGAPYSLIGAISNVPPGGVASLPWPGRQYGTAYEWYVVVNDPNGGSTIGPTWRFVTGTNTGPTVGNQILHLTGDSPTNTALQASDINNDPLIFRTNSLPQFGIIPNFNPTNGTFTYRPARGFRGLDQFTFSVSDGSITSSIVAMYLNVIAPPDTNGNNLPDAWESAYGLTNPTADNDGDGRNNLEEYLANTNPTNAASVFRITSVTRDALGHVTLVWPSSGGIRYRVQFGNGGPGGSFNGVFTDIVRPLSIEMDPAIYNAASTQSFVDIFSLTGVPTNGGRYFRIKIVK